MSKIVLYVYTEKKTKLARTNKIYNVIKLYVPINRQLNHFLNWIEIRIVEISEKPE